MPKCKFTFRLRTDSNLSEPRFTITQVMDALMNKTAHYEDNGSVVFIIETKTKTIMAVIE